MILKELHIINYKNISEKKIVFDDKINAFIGKNGVGKTNILDAIYHLSVGKSYFNPLNNQNIKHNETFFLIEGSFIADDQSQEMITCSYKNNQKKVLKRNGKIYEKLSDHIGLIPVVIISPSDADLISQGSEFRRKFFDSIISFLDPHYLSLLISYQRILVQRNALLKYFVANQVFDANNLSVYDDQLVDFGCQIHEKRKDFILEFQKIFEQYYQIISDDREKVFIHYQSQLLENDFFHLLKSNLQKDRMLQYSSVGIHKDDYVFEMENFPIKKFGSQGQQKSFLIALKLAHFEIINKKMKNLPILLFDDVFDKLDEVRVGKIVQLINDDVFGQIFLTDTHSERIEHLVKKIMKSFRICTL